MPRLRTVIALSAVTLFLAAGVVNELDQPRVELRTITGAATDLRVDAAIPIDDAFALVAIADRMAAHVEGLFGRRFTKRPKIAVFATPEAFAWGTSHLFGYSRGDSDFVAAMYGGIFDRRSEEIALDANGGEGGTTAIVEHELVHQMVRELSHGAALPAWFEEGIATLVAQEDAPSDEWIDEESLEGRAVAARGGVSFATLDTLNGWDDAYGRVGEALYDYAAEALRAMEAPIGWTTVVGIVADVGAGTAFADAYAREAHEPLSSVEARLDAGATAAIIVRDKPNADDHVEWILFTGIPNRETTVSITGGRSYSVTFTVTTDDLGIYRAVFGSTAQPGMYVVRAAGMYAILDTDQ